MSRDSPAAEPLRVVLVTGASAGLGAAVCRELVRQGKVASLVLTARRADRLEQLTGELSAMRAGLQIHSIAADLADPAAPERLVREAEARCGGIDLLVNNAGFGLPTLFRDSPPEHLAEQIAVNFTAPLMLTRFCLPSLTKRKGMIINIGSAITCVANSALGAYGATKSGLAYWNDALRRELHGTGVRVCLVEPGPFRSEFMGALSARLASGRVHARILNNTAAWMIADADEVARRAVRLVVAPRRRVSVLRRLVWPFRAVGAIARACPPLGDLLVVAMQGRPEHSAPVKR
jgi:short-subunit dehydrogenase